MRFDITKSVLFVYTITLVMGIIQTEKASSIPGLPVVPAELLPVGRAIPASPA